MKPSVPVVPGITPRGSEHGGQGKMTLERLAAMMMSPDWAYVDNAAIGAVSPDYVMDPVPQGVVRLIIHAHVNDAAAPALGAVAQAYIEIVDGNNLGIVVAEAEDVSENLNAGAYAVAHVSGLVLRPGMTLGMHAANAISLAGIRYVDVWM